MMSADSIKAVAHPKIWGSWIAAIKQERNGFMYYYIKSPEFFSSLTKYKKLFLKMQLAEKRLIITNQKNRYYYI